MKYVAIDIETTGLDWERDQVLQIALVIEDTTVVTAEGPAVEELSTWEGLVWHERIEGDPIALKMNAELIEVLAFDFLAPGAGFTRFLRGREVRVWPSFDVATRRALEWLAKEHGTANDANDPVGAYVAAGKNIVGFDLQFMPRRFRQCFHHRVIDVGSVAMGAMRGTWSGKRVPGLAELHDGAATHDALDDARNVVRLLRKLTGRYGLTDD